MKPDSLMKFKGLFEEQKRNLLYTHAVINDEFVLPKDETIDDADMTSVELEQSMRMRLRNREALYIKKIDEALRRIAEGSFGKCKICEEEIELKRLEARPTATHCVTCKEEQERVEQIHADGRKPKSLGQKIRLRLA